MAAEATVTAETVSAEATHFLARRLHSLFGIVPLGVFLVEHLWGNATALAVGPGGGEQAYNAYIRWWAEVPFARYLLEAVVLGLPLAYHALYGLFITAGSGVNLDRYPLGRNLDYVIMRATGVLLLAFIAFHVLALRFADDVAASPDRAFAAVADHLASNGVFVFYVAGIIAATYHLANGIRTFARTWGIAATPRALRVCHYAVAVPAFVALTFAGLLAASAFRPDLSVLGYLFLALAFVGSSAVFSIR